jgi:hypothetical protein
LGVRELSKVRIGGKVMRLSRFVARGPQIAFTALQPRQIAENSFAFLTIGLALNPGADRIAVLARRQFHRDQNVSL